MSTATVDPGLAVRDLSVWYGGHCAVSPFSFEAPHASITGLIGPNGAGKTTVFDACNGILRPRSGTLNLFGRDITSMPTAARARLGLGRTFQRIELCESMTVVSNVALGLEARLVGANPLRQFAASWSERSRMTNAAEAALERCGIAQLAHMEARALSTGQRRLVEVARVLAGGFSFLLLDEPSAGLDEEESAAFGRLLRTIVDDGDVGILMVEHDMSLVMSTCSYLYVLDFGKLIFDGPPSEVQQSPIVRAAYLGDAFGEEAE